MNGVTGRMGTNQHLVRSILAIREQGGLLLPDGTMLWPEPVLVGRDESKLRGLAEAHGLSRVSTDLDACLADPGELDLFRRADDLAARAGAAGGDCGGQTCVLRKTGGGFAG